MQFSLTRNLIGLLFFWQAGLGERKEAHLDKLDEAACVALDTLPPDLAIALSVFDTDSSGILDMDQMRSASEFLTNAKALNQQGRVPISSFPDKDRKALHEWDCDGDGSISSEEILRGFQALRAEKEKSKQLFRIAVGALFAVLILAGALSGLTFVIVELSKDTNVQGDGVLRVKGSEEVVKTGYALQEAGLSSRIPDEDFRQLMSVTISNAEDAWINFKILAVSRYPGERRQTQYLSLVCKREKS